MTSVILDLLALAVLAFCVWQGYRKGFVLTLATIIVVFIAAFSASGIAEKNALSFSDKLQPILSWVADDAVDEAMSGKGSSILTNTEIQEIAKSSFEKLGIQKTDKLVRMTFETLEDEGVTVRGAISATYLFSVTYTIISLLAFIMFMLLFLLILHFVASVVRLPVIKGIDSYIGIGLGFVFGLLIIGATGWALANLGGLISPELMGKTFLMKLIANTSVLSGILSF